MFTLPKYYEPDFSSELLKNVPDAKWEEEEADGVAPENYHSTVTNVQDFIMLTIKGLGICITMGQGR